MGLKRENIAESYVQGCAQIYGCAEDAVVVVGGCCCPFDCGKSPDHHIVYVTNTRKLTLIGTLVLGDVIIWQVFWGS